MNSLAMSLTNFLIAAGFIDICVSLGIILGLVWWANAVLKDMHDKWRDDGD